MTAADDVILTKRIKIKFPTKRVEAEPGTESSGIGPKLTTSCEQDQSKYINEDESKNKLRRCMDHLPHDKELIADNAKIKSSQASLKKRAALEIMEGPKEKKQRLDRTVKQQCTCILRKLMSHPAAWVFSRPVDPVALKIPDYFSIISDPMDLGTIKSKLDKNMYFCTEDFAADVRLTFSNAMLYNPPSNYVHSVAKELNDVFDKRWKPVESKVNREMLKLDQGKASSGRAKDIPQLRQNSNKTTASCDSLSLKKPMSFKEKEMLRKELVEALKGKIPPHLCDVLKKLGQNQETIKACIDTFDEKMLWELKRIMKSGAGAAKVDSKAAQKCLPMSSEENVHKGIGSEKRRACGFPNVKLPSSLVGCSCGSQGTGTCHCNHKCDSSHESSSGLSSDKPVINDGATKMVENTSVTQNRRSDSDGAVSALDEENSCLTSQFTAPATVSGSTEDDTPTFDVHLSPKKALRAAMLKSRFADTILKAQQKTLLDHRDKADPAKMQQEKERLERKQREEKCRIEAQIRAAEAASLLKAEAEFKIQREREREAARIALQQMERTIDIDDNLVTLKDLEMLSGCSVSFFPSEVALRELENGSPHAMNPLEQLGLFMKDDYAEDEEDVVFGEVREEGEILC